MIYSASNPSLDIILITYNRKEHLQATLESLFAEDSPVRSLPLTILNNASTDGSTELINDYCQRFPNIKHTIHNRNIGGNANIMRAFEIATADYVWVLCDDDEFDFTHWHAVETAIANGADAIVVANYLNPKENLAQLVGQMTFVPSTIYKTEHLTATVMVNMAWNISTMFPQLAPVAYLFNHHKRIEVLDHWIVRMVSTCDESSYVRGLNEDKHPLMSSLFWQVGFLNALALFNEIALKRHIIDTLRIDNGSPCFNIGRLLEGLQRVDIAEACHDWNMATAWANLAFYPKKRYLLFVLYIIYVVFHVSWTWDKKVFKIIFNHKHKIKLWDKRWLLRTYKQPKNTLKSNKNGV
ncbi:MAG: glycosyltransferase family 2 protein [Vampirovibrio sp.]